MSKRMLIDGAHPEEIRVVVTSGNKLDEYDIETTFKKQIKGNIYLAKVTRVEPSLQAAFVDFGGNRHGFLAFSEIHPDYYQIPVEDRQALIDEQEALELKARAAREHLEDIDGDLDAEDETIVRNSMEEPQDQELDGLESTLQNENNNSDPEPVAANPEVEEVLEAVEAATPRRTRSMQKYKIQEVIKRRQILLVQVVKEERGNKGAALTTYISLAGRYCVLMPNSSRGGGISRKITAVQERRKLRETLNSLNIQQGMGVIIRTAGLERNKAEIKRDFEYLIRAWDEVREKTMLSTAPDMVYEEGDIIKRAIRDLYSKDIDEIQVEGPDTYQKAKRFMRLMMPSHAKRVQQYRDKTMPLFQRFQIEQQMDGMHNPEVMLSSGGYIVINPTEALVAIDVNSGKATKERNIEETALKTNIEAADEIARQLRLRDLAGLIVIDFIDMEDNRNIRRVERRLKDAMKVDRARLQIGRISSFGLLELSRQRLRPSLIEASSQICPHCRGTGNILSIESMAMRVLRTIEEEGIRLRSSEIIVSIPTSVALYILNQKRSTLTNLENKYGFLVVLEGDESVVPPDIKLERVKGKPERLIDEAPDLSGAVSKNTETKSLEEEKGKPRRPRRKRSRKRPQENAETAKVESADTTLAKTQKISEGLPDDESDEEKAAQKRRKRGRRGGRRRPRTNSAKQVTDSEIIEKQEETIAPKTPSRSPKNKGQNDEAKIGIAKSKDPNTEDDGIVAKTKQTEEKSNSDGSIKRKGWWQRMVQ